MSAPIDLPPQPRILVINMRRIGDLLLTTPLMRSLRNAFPEARLDALVFSGTEGILSGNPDLDDVIAISPRPGLREMLRLVRRIGRGYDLAIATQAGDRPAFLALIAGRRRIGIAPPSGRGRWKTSLYHRSIEPRAHEHRLVETARLASILQIAPKLEVVCPAGPGEGVAPSQPYAVVHAAPMFAYRRWTPEGWRQVARHLSQRGLRVLATGGPDPAERAYLDAVWRDGDAAVERVDGRLNWPQLAALLAKAEVYVGPDTSVTHLAAASGCPTVAVFGPTDPRLWGPWPAAGLQTMWEAAAPVQRRGNVWLLQNVLPCLPCQEEGCERRLDSASACLAELTPTSVVAVVNEALQGGDAGGVGAQRQRPV